MTPLQITGRIIEAGDDGSGQPAIVIHTTVDELINKPIPFYTDCIITFTPIEP